MEGNSFSKEAVKHERGLHMKKRFTKIIALLASLILIFSLAACGEKDEPTNTNTENTNVTENNENDLQTDSTSDSDEPSESTVQDTSVTDESENEESDSVNQPQENGTSVAQPTDTASGVRLYNDAVAKIKNTNASITRKIGYARAEKGPLKVDLLSFSDDIEKIFQEGDGPISSKLSTLNAKDVKGFSSKKTANGYELKFELKEVTCDQYSKVGINGYMHFITMQEVEVIVKQMCDKLTGGNVEVTVYRDKSSLILKDGVFTVNIDKNTGKITSATLAFTEVINGKVKAPIVGTLAIDADAFVEGYCTVNYKFS